MNEVLQELLSLVAEILLCFLDTFAVFTVSLHASRREDFRCDFSSDSMSDFTSDSERRTDSRDERRPDS